MEVLAKDATEFKTEFLLLRALCAVEGGVGDTTDQNCHDGPNGIEGIFND